MFDVVLKIKKNIMELKFVENIEPLYTSVAPLDKIFRYDYGDDRYYFRMVGGEVYPYMSITTVAGKVVGYTLKEGLTKWRVGLGEAADYIAKTTAMEGTLQHEYALRAAIEKAGDYDLIHSEVMSYAGKEGFPTLGYEWSVSVRNVVACFMEFFKERNVRLIAAEFPVYSDQAQIAGLIDSVVEMDFDKKRIIAIIDNKRGNNHDSPDYKFQLNAQRIMWNDMFGEIFPVTHIFNWSATNWANKVKYTLTNQTGKAYSDDMMMRSLMAVPKTNGWVKMPKTHNELVGKFTLEEFDILKNILNFEIKPQQK
jgi:hypothetical protein